MKRRSAGSSSQAALMMTEETRASVLTCTYTIRMRRAALPLAARRRLDRASYNTARWLAACSQIAVYERVQLYAEYRVLLLLKVDLLTPRAAAGR